MRQSFLAALLVQAWKVSAGCAIVFSLVCGRELEKSPHLLPLISVIQVNRDVSEPHD